MASQPVDELDLRAIGEIIVNLGAASALAVHSQPRSTLRDYSHPRSPEMEFVRDMFLLPTEEIADRWYGGEFEAARRASWKIESQIG